MKLTISVAVGVILNPNNEVLIAQRPETGSFPGLWEFPGGKLERHESPETALIRELQEEVGITVTAAQPLVHFTHANPAAGDVELFCFNVISYQGKPYGKEGQLTRWVPVNTLSEYEFPAANQRIIDLVVALPTSVV